jgi:superfamily II DNA or RNA helicase
MELFPYQRELIRKLYDRIREGDQRILLYAPTGAGKTVIVSSVIRDALSRNREVLFLVHRNELVSQTVSTLARFDIEAGVIKAGWTPDDTKPVQVASIQTLASRGAPPLDIVFIDECHTTSYYKACRELLESHKGLIIGVTATPWRTRKREGLSEYYHNMVSAPTPKVLIEKGFLVPPRTYGYNNTIDLKQVRTRAGEFAIEDLDVVCNTPGVIQRIVDEYQRLAGDRTCICFAVNVEHARNIAMAFNAYGVPADHIEAATHPMARSEKYQALDRGEIKVLSSVGVLTEGFDVRSVRSIILARPTKSMALHYQMIGRGLRTCPEVSKEDCIVLDFANNTERHGMVQMLDKVDMDTPLETEGGAMTKSCPACFTVVPLDVMTCPECGYSFPLCDGEGEKRERLEDLVELLPPDEKKKRQAFIKYSQYAYENGMSPNWASHMFKGKFLKWPAPVHRFRAVFGDESTLENQEAYLQYLIGCQNQKPSKDPESFIRNHMEWEFGESLIQVEGLPSEIDPEEEVLHREKIEDAP